MKKIMVCLLLVLCLMGTAQATEAWEERVRNLLTEVYGYSVAESESFVIEAQFADGIWHAEFAHADHPEWVYTAQFQPDGNLLEAQTPFAADFLSSNYPGEGTVRQAVEQMPKWFASWEENGPEDMLGWMTQQGVNRTHRLEEGLKTRTISAGNALREFFTGCYGQMTGWTKSLREWEKTLLDQFGLKVEAVQETDGIITYEVSLTQNHVPMTATRFKGEVPEDMRSAVQHPALEGWTVLCGAYGECSDAETMEKIMIRETGLLALGKGEERLLVMLAREGIGEWKLYSVGTKALLPGRDFYITGNPAEQLYEIVYPVSDTLSEVYAVRVQDFCRLQYYRRIDQLTGEGIQIRVSSYGKYEITEYGANGEQRMETIEEPQMNLLHLIDITQFPTTLEACQKAEAIYLPDGYGVAAGVHLRAQTSSRSKDLGDYNPGTIVEILGMKNGDPYDWYHVRVGSVEGYMSSVYVDYEGSVCMMTPLTGTPLPVGEAKENIKLRQNKGVLNTGLFAKTVQEIPAGTRMHILAETGSWLHVMIPSGEIGWMMDINGTDGYVKKDEIKQINITALPLQEMQ